ncbi:MAG TPA: M6 family metalloprotease domain-containing protein [Candidatus Cloacimonadota bacterium]|nr:M6 family metalloprotease domain-containing protein [Candidatus Cloacimonadota bacterium]
MKAVFVSVFVLFVLSLSANLVQDMPVKIAQTDGTKLSLYVSGDEFEHVLHDADGYTVLSDPATGDLVYALPEGKSIKASAYRVGISSPSSLGIQPGLRPDPSSRISLLRSRTKAEGSNDRTPTTGTINNLVIFIRFLDQLEYTDPLAEYNTLFNDAAGPSLKDYFQEVSSNQLNVSTTFYPAAVSGVVRSFQDGHIRGYFSPFSAGNPGGYSDLEEGQDRLQAMLRQAVISVGPSVPSSLQIDMDNDGQVDNVTFIAQGDPDPLWASMLWPHRWSLYPSPSPQVYINSKLVKGYSFLLSNTIRVGVACHEMSHSLGFPDLYHYSHDALNPVGEWDVMGAHGDVPQQHLTYTKWKYGGWFSTIPTITPSGIPTTYTLTAIDQNPYSCYKIASSVPNQYYMLEYRRDTGMYESSIPGSGLIIYRVCPEVLNPLMQYEPVTGNDEGPPDEVYVYRPGGEMYNDGYVTEANFASNLNRTSINDYTDPSPWLYNLQGNTQLDGNLMITDVGSAAGSTISFTVHGTSPYIWRGATSANWSTASNWIGGAVPPSNAWVEIPPSEFINGSGWTYSPNILSEVNVQNITIQHGAGLFIGSGFLGVSGNLANYGELGTMHDSAQLSVSGDLTFYSGSSSRVHNAAHFYIQGDLTLYANSDVEWYDGYIEFQGTGNSYIRNYANTRLWNLQSNKTYPYAVYISDESCADLTIKNNLFVYAGSTLRQSYTGNTILQGSLNVSTDGYCALDHGALLMQGYSASNLIFPDSSSYLHDLIINQQNSQTVTLGSNFWVKGDIELQAGVFNASTRTLRLGGNWTNSIGTAGFNCGISTVTLNGTATQTISTERFYRLELNKPSGVWSIPAGVTIQTDYYNWTAGVYNVSGGSFSTTFLDDPGVLGTITLSSGTINYNQSSSAALDLRGNVTISGGTFNLSGGNGSSVYFSYTDLATLTMSGGVLDLKSKGIFIPAAYAFNDYFTGGRIRTVGSITIQRTDFSPIGGVIELYGDQDSSVYVAAGSSFNLLQLSKSPQERCVTASSNLNLNGSLEILSGCFDPSGHTITVNNDLLVFGSLKMLSAATINVGDEVLWNGGDQVSAGTILCGGDWTFSSGATADLSGSAVYLNNPYGSTLVNSSATARFGDLHIQGTEEDPVCYYSSGSGSSLKVTGLLTVHETIVLNLSEGICQAGSLTIMDTGGFVVGDGGSLTVTNSLNLSGVLNVGPGSVTVHGFFIFSSTGALLIDYGSFVNDAPWFDMRGSVNLRGGIIMNGGYLEITNNNTYLYGHAQRVFSYSTLSLGRSFYATDAGAYQPVGGSLDLFGDGNPSLMVNNGNFLTDLNVQKSSSSACVYLASDLIVTGNLNLDMGILNLGSNTLSLNSGKSLNVNSDATLIAEGSTRRYALLTRNGAAGHYSLNVNSGGSISAIYTTFEYMDANGIYLHTGSSVDQAGAFSHCVFRNGAAGGSLLRSDNSQNLTIDAASFPANTWSGTYNVSKTINTGNLTLINYSGTFSGTAFEQDPYSRIDWQANGIMPVLNLTITRQSGVNPVHLTWEYPYSYTGFRIYASDSPDGTFTLIGSSPNLYWSGPAASGRKFYRVTAEN